MTSSARRSTITRSHATTSKTRCGRLCAYVEALLDTARRRILPRTARRLSRPSPAPSARADLIVRIGSTIHVIDFKFGAGVRVLALYPDGDEDIINAQLLFYAAAARHSLPEFFAGVDDIVLTILQPQSIEPDAEMVSSVAVTHAELDEFIALYRAACEEALAPTPRLERGDHCRFCPARPICPAHTGPLLDLAQFAVPTPPATRSDYLQLLADGLDLVDAVKDIGKALHDQAKRALAAATLVPGYALSAGRAVRQWRDESAAVARADRSRARPRRRARRDDALAQASRTPRQGARPQSPQGIDRFASLRRRRWCGAKTHAPRCPGGARSCGHFPRRLKPSKEGGHA